jgi:hypothetical protein
MSICCCNKIPEAGYLKRKEVYLAQFWRLKVQDQVAPSIWPLVVAVGGGVAASQQGSEMRRKTVTYIRGQAHGAASCYKVLLRLNSFFKTSIDPFSRQGPYDLIPIT